MMRAALVVENGRPVQVREIPSPEPSPGRTLVEVEAAAITPLDLLVASGTSYFGDPAKPYVPGVQGIGRVLASERFVEGSRVWFQTSAGITTEQGSMAAVAQPKDEFVVDVGEELDVVALAALGLSAVAAHRCLHEVAGIAHGESVLVLGASGVVGSSAVQFARLAGAGHVVAAGRRPGFARRALTLGANRAIDITPHESVEEYLDAYRDAAPDGFDVVIDPLCGNAATAALRHMRPGGRLVNLGSSQAPSATFDSAILRSKQLRILGYTNAELDGAAVSSTMEAVVALLREGKLSAESETHPLDQAGEAWQRAALGKCSGRAVLVLGETA
ncbi:MAG: zinc-binding alcohol dehydrogenase family protein [Actinomycetota bacterium]|nr:zinc-binding alcohol dehydrogenase family protein [Actinomycetota bacterium]MDA8209429.1 zinc-binding alcohol dehydrogenase family protein [Actinomycetota bacterium]